MHRRLWLRNRRRQSLGTDLAKGKLTLPVLLLWERANATDRQLVQGLVQGWNSTSLPGLGQLLEKYEALPAALTTVHHS